MEIMKINPDREAVLLKRDNRFIATIRIGTSITQAHVHDPGRLEELLYPGNRILIKHATGKHRKTEWDVIAARFENLWVFTNSGYHRRIAEEILKIIYPGYTLKPEVKLGHSRIDFFATSNNEKIAIEVKGCTLARNGVALFPDAPTSRGRRHVEELIRFIKSGGKATLLILVFRSDSLCFLPNGNTDPEFEDVFWKAVDSGVDIIPVILKYDPPVLSYLGKIPLCNSK